MRHHTLLAALLLLPSLLVFSLAGPVHAAVSWNVEVVDENATGYATGYCPIVLDCNNSSHIAYTDRETYYDNGRARTLALAMYAIWNGSAWTTQRIDFGTVTDLVLDANGRPNILYQKGVQGGLTYARWTGTTWALQTVDAKSPAYASLALDSSGNPHTAYKDDMLLKYASGNGSSWTIQTVATYSSLSPEMFLAIDSNNKPYILFNNLTKYKDPITGFSYDSMDVKLATLESSVWNIQTIPLPPPIGDHKNVVLDSNGHPRFVFVQDHFASAENITRLIDILYANWDGASWSLTPIVSNIHPVGLGHLALDSFNNPHISYVSGFELMYLAWTGDSWCIQKVNVSLYNVNVSVRGPSYISVEPNGIPHISFLAVPPYQGLNSPILYVVHAWAKEPIQTAQSTATPSATEPVPTSPQPTSTEVPSQPIPNVTLLLILVTAVVGTAITVVIYAKIRKRSRN